jgi:psp operon transcriptional activator
MLLDYDWPGNVRELKNVVERSVYRSNNPYVPVHQILFDPFESPFRPISRVRTNDRITAVQEHTTVGKTVTSVDNAAAPQPREQTQTTIDFAQAQDFKLLSENYEVTLIKQALAACQYNQKKTAEALNLTYHQLRGYMKKYKLLDSQQ